MVESESKSWKDFLQESWNLRNKDLVKSKEDLKSAEVKFNETIINLKKLKEYFPNLKSAGESSTWGTRYADWEYSFGSIKTDIKELNELTDTESTSKLYLQGKTIPERFSNKKERMKSFFFDDFAENLHKCDTLEEIEKRIKVYKTEAKEFKEGLDRLFKDLFQPIADLKLKVENIEKEVAGFRQKAKDEYIKYCWPALQSNPLYLKDKKGEKIGYVKVLNEDKSGLGYTVEDIESGKKTYHVKLSNLGYDFREFNKLENELRK